MAQSPKHYRRLITSLEESLALITDKSFEHVPTANTIRLAYHAHKLRTLIHTTTQRFKRKT